MEKIKYLDKDRRELMEFAASQKELYANGDPFPNIYFDDFFASSYLDEVLEEFPDMKKKPDIEFNDPNQIKLASDGEYRFGPKTLELMHFLNSQTFLEFLSELTGIPDLIPDPYFEGGGCHQILPGGRLNVHADFNKNNRTKLDRRLNVLVYLNKDWDESYGGHFELWDKDMTHSVKKILPLFNRMAMFSTTTFSYHGHPNPLTCPPDRSRKSLALYYYTNGRPAEEVIEDLENHTTIFKARPGTDDQKMDLKYFVKQVTPPFLVDLAKKLTR